MTVASGLGPSPGLYIRKANSRAEPLAALKSSAKGHMDRLQSRMSMERAAKQGASERQKIQLLKEEGN